MIREYIENNLSEEDKKYIKIESDATISLLNQLDRNLVSNQESLGLPYWSKKEPGLVRDFTYIMHKNGMGKTIVKMRWSEFRFNNDLLNSSEILKYRVIAKMNKYKLRLNTEQTVSDLVKTKSGIGKTGLRRAGFAIAAKREFKLDVKYIIKYREIIYDNLVKGINKQIKNGNIKDKFIEDKANHKEIINALLDYYIAGSENSYNNELNVSDSRGRSIFKAVKRIGNIISSKDFRAMMIAGEPILVSLSNDDQMNDIYYFIAEMNGTKSVTESSRVVDGKAFYEDRKLPKLSKKNLYKIIWLERIYDRLERLHSGILSFVKWDIPLEVDASMSLAQISGALLNDERLLSRTSVLGSEMNDPWEIKGSRRDSNKKAGTPRFYGSNKSIRTLINSSGGSYYQMLMEETPEASMEAIEDAKEKDRKEIAVISKEFNNGGLSMLIKFKNAILEGYTNHKPKIHMNIWNDSFSIDVNKWKGIGASILVTEAFTDKGYKRSFTREPKLIPDYEYMKLFWYTCLIHNIESQMMNNIVFKMANEWIITIHDAALALPGIAGKVRESYAIELKSVNKARKKIINNFRLSIGATRLIDNIRFMKLDKSIVQANEDEAYNAHCMK